VLPARAGTIGDEGLEAVVSHVNSPSIIKTTPNSDSRSGKTLIGEKYP
jgi:hypothetical protein